MLERVGTWMHWSPSQVAAYRRCPSRWALKYLFGQDAPAGKGAELGKTVHALLEHYLLTGEAPSGDDERAVEIATAAIPGLPAPPLRPALVEREVWIDGAGQIPPAKGVIDLLLPGDSTPEIIDHKTTSSIVKFAKTEEQLRFDPQAIVYAYAVMDESAWVPDHVVVSLRYTQTQGAAKTETRSARFTADEVREAFERLVGGTVSEMASCARDVQTLEDVRFSIEACGDYGGCPYRVRCAKVGRSTSPFASLFQSDTPKESPIMPGIAEIIAARKAQLAEQATESTTTQATEPVDSQSTADGTDPAPVRIYPHTAVDDALVDSQPTADGTDPAPRAETEINPPDGTPADVVGEVSTGPKRGTSRPSYSDDESVPEWARGVPLDGAGSPSKVRMREEILPHMRAFLAERYGIEDADPLVDEKGRAIKGTRKADYIVEAVRLRNRVEASVVRDGSKQDRAEEEETPAVAPPITIADVVPETHTDVADDPEQLEELDKIKDESGFRDVTVRRLEEALLAAENRALRLEEGFDLYIGCAPRGHIGVVYLDELLAEHQERAAEAAKLPHYLMIPYGQGPKLAAASLANALESGDLDLHGAVVARPMLPGTDAAVEVMLPHARRVITVGG